MSPVIPLTHQMLDDHVNISHYINRMMSGHLDDATFKMMTGRSRWQPNPFPSLRLFRWLPANSTRR